MTNDHGIRTAIARIERLSKEFLSQPNQDAYSDRIVEDIIDTAEKLKVLYDTNKPSN